MIETFRGGHYRLSYVPFPPVTSTILHTKTDTHHTAHKYSCQTQPLNTPAIRPTFLQKLWPHALLSIEYSCQTSSQHRPRFLSNTLAMHPAFCQILVKPLPRTPLSIKYSSHRPCLLSVKYSGHALTFCQILWQYGPLSLKVVWPCIYILSNTPATQPTFQLAM